MASLGRFLNFNSFNSNELQGEKLWIFWKDVIMFQALFSTSQLVISWFSFMHQHILDTFVYAKCTYMKRWDLYRELEVR